MKNKTLDEWYKDYRDFRVSHGFSIVNVKCILKSFVNWCHKHYPDEYYLTQEMINEWGTKRDTEDDITFMSRTSPINAFIRHINLRGGDLQKIERETNFHSPPPRSITEEELKNVFRAADEMKILSPTHSKYRESLVRALEMPVLLRLMYSSGLRPPEIRLLERKNVDLENGLITIRAGKGYNERLVALDWKVNELLKVYDQKMQDVIPDRLAFFPDCSGGYRSNYSLSTCWRSLCDKYNQDTKGKKGKHGLVIYSLRHLYITRNVEKLPQNGWEKDIHLLALSRSAGHSKVNTTIKHYYHLTARSGELLDEKMGETYDSIIPDIED